MRRSAFRQQFGTLSVTVVPNKPVRRYAPQFTGCICWRGMAMAAAVPRHMLRLLRTGAASPANWRFWPCWPRGVQ